MQDLFSEFGQDLHLSATGDLRTVTRKKLTDQRLLRRLLTAPQDYLWHQAYGAGLGRLIGQAEKQKTVTALISAQLTKEPDIASFPPPSVQVSAGDIISSLLKLLIPTLPQKALSLLLLRLKADFLWNSTCKTSLPWSKICALPYRETAAIYLTFPKDRF